MTIGEDRVRIKFNPSASSFVDHLKQKTADLIDMCETLGQPSDGTLKGWTEQSRAAAHAQTHYEIAAMWAVKAATA